MLLKLYSFAILAMDVTMLFVKCFVAIAEKVYEKIVPQPEKSVSGEIVLV